MEKAIVRMLQLLTCVQFIGFLGISTSHLQACWLLLLSVWWCFTCFVSLLCFSCRYLHSSTCDFVFCIWGFAFVAFLLSLVACVVFEWNCFFFCHPGSPWGCLLPFWGWCLICFAPYSFCYQFYLIVPNIYLCFSSPTDPTYATIYGCCRMVFMLS